MSEDDHHHAKFMDCVRTYNWQGLAVLLKDVGPARAEQLVTSLVDREKHATALIVCARSSLPTSSNTLLPPGPPQGGEEGSGGVLETSQLLVKYGADLNHRDSGGRSALHWAVSSHKVQLTALLLSLGSDVSTTDNKGHTALHTAICAGNEPGVALLLQHDRQVLDEGDAHGTPPLTLAVQHGHVDICRQLLEAGADVTAQEVQTLRTPLHYALYLKHLDIFSLLLSFKPNLRVVDHRGTTVIHRCCAVQEPDYLARALGAGNDVVGDVINMEDHEQATPVIIACQNDNLKNLQLLLDKGAKVDTRDIHGRTALHHCVENSDTACAEQLLRTEPSLLSATDGEGLTPLHMAVIAGNVPLIRLLLKRGASLQCRDQEEHTVAHWATVCGHAKVLDVLLEYGADLNAADKHQAFPIHYAAQMTRKPVVDEDDEEEEEEKKEVEEEERRGRRKTKAEGDTRLLRKLLDNGVSANVRDKDDRTPIIWAASAGNAEACRVLTEAGADVNAPDKDGLSALHCAASRGHGECARTLVSTCGARVDPLDKNQCTPLFYATTLGHEQCVKVLLELGARPNHTDSRGRTSQDPEAVVFTWKPACHNDMGYTFTSQQSMDHPHSPVRVQPAVHTDKAADIKGTAHCAAVKGSRESIQALQKQGVDLWQPTAKGDYPLHEAAQAGHVEVIEYLLEERGQKQQQQPGKEVEEEEEEEEDVINLGNKDGRTCLHIAALTNNLWLAKFLLDRRAHINAIMRNKGKNYTPFDAAVAKGNKEAAEYLLSRGARSASTLSPADLDKPIKSKKKGNKGQNHDETKNQNSKNKRQNSAGKEKLQTTVKENSIQGEEQSGNKNDESASQTIADQEDGENHQPVVAVVVKHIDRPVPDESSPKNSLKSKQKQKVSQVDSEKEKTEDIKQTSTEAKESTEKLDDRNQSSVEVEVTQTNNNADASVTHVNENGSSDTDATEEKHTKDITASVQDSDRKGEIDSKEDDTTDRNYSEEKTEKKQHHTSSVKENTEKENQISDSESTSTLKSERQRNSPKSEKTRHQHRPRSGDPLKSGSENGDDVTTPVKTEAQQPDETLSDSEPTTTTTSTFKSQREEEDRTSTASSASHRSRNIPRTKTSDPTPEHERPRSRSSSRSSSRSRSSRSHSRSRSRSRSPTPSSGMGSSSSKPKGASKGGGGGEGEGLNLFSDNENTDEEMEDSTAREDKGKGEASEDLGGKEPQRRRPKSSRLIASIQESVKRYEQERRSIRQLQQLRRAQIYHGHTRNLALFHSLLQTYSGARGAAPTWDQILQEHSKPRDGNSLRSRASSKPATSYTGSNDSVSTPNKEKGNKTKSDLDKESDLPGKATSPGRKRGGTAPPSKGTTPNKHPGDPQKRPLSDHPHNGPSPRKHTHQDFREGLTYRQLQKQRTEDMHRLLIKAYRPVWPQDLLHSGGKPQASGKLPDASSTNGQGGSRSSVRHPRTPTSSTVKSSSRLPAPGGQQQASPTTPGRSREGTPSGVSHAQFRAVQRSYTLITPAGSRRIRSDGEHQPKTARSRAATLNVDDRNHLKSGVIHNNNGAKATRISTARSNPR